MSEFSLHLGDCIEGMRALEDRSVDHVICDPPYSNHVHNSLRSGARTSIGGSVICRERELDFSHLDMETMKLLAEQYTRICKRWVLIFSDTESDHLWRAALQSMGLEYVRTCFWRKGNGAPQFTGDRPAVALEAITLCHPIGRKRWNGGGKQGFYDFNIVTGHSENRCHPTQKPLTLMRALIQDFTDPDELILDSHAGSGTTGLAALELGRRFVGFELDPKHHATALERLNNAQRQEQLFSRPMKQLSLTGG